MKRLNNNQKDQETQARKSLVLCLAILKSQFNNNLKIKIK